MKCLSPYHFIHGDCHVMGRSYLYFSHRRLSFQIFLHMLRKCDVLVMCHRCRFVHLATDVTDMLITLPRAAWEPGALLQSNCDLEEREEHTVETSSNPRPGQNQ